jgi:hypothetical protein
MKHEMHAQPVRIKTFVSLSVKVLEGMRIVSQIKNILGTSIAVIARCSIGHGCLPFIATFRTKPPG